MPSTKRSKTSERKVKKDRSDREVKTKEKKKDKGKSREHDGQFKVVQASLLVSIPPVFANDLHAGVEEMLDSMVMRYIPALQGVVIAHDNLRFLDSTTTIKADCPFANCRITFDATVWSPHVGMKLVGKVNLCSPDHISLLVHRTFNVSIPRHHIPADNWEFEYGPAENDPEFGVGTEQGDHAEPAVEVVGEGSGEEGKQGVEDSGRWIHKVTGTRLGGSDGYLEFTVIGLTIANQMLSLVGSIQEDPFSPEHVSQDSLPSTAISSTRVQPSLADQATHDSMQDEDDESDVDPFDVLSRIKGDVKSDPYQNMKGKEGAKKDRKRKRKDAKVENGIKEGHGEQDNTKRKKS